MVLDRAFGAPPVELALSALRPVLLGVTGARHGFGRNVGLPDSEVCGPRGDDALKRDLASGDAAALGLGGAV